MIKKTTIFIFLSYLFVLQVSAAGISDAFGSKLETVANDSGYDPISSAGDVVLQERISSYITLVLSFLGVIFLILTIYAGFLWMTAQGNESQVKKAKEIMTRAVIGFVIVASAYSISYFVISKLGAGQLKLE